MSAHAQLPRTGFSNSELESEKGGGHECNRKLGWQREAEKRGKNLELGREGVKEGDGTLRTCEQLWWYDMSNNTLF